MQRFVFQESRNTARGPHKKMDTFYFVVTSSKTQAYLALINRAGGLYGRILTEVVSTDRTQ